MLADVLSEETVVPDLDAGAKSEVVDLLLDVLCGTGKVLDREQARRDLEDNDRRTSVGMEHGIAIPHAKTDAVPELVACIGVTRQPLDIESLDGHPAQIFIMTLSPKDASGPHIRFLSEIGKLLKHRAKRKAVLKAATRSDLLHALLSR